MLVRLKSIEEIMRDDPTAFFHDQGDGKKGVSFSDGKLPIVSGMLDIFGGKVIVDVIQYKDEKLSCMVNGGSAGGCTIYESFFENDYNDIDTFLDDLFSDIV